MAGIGDIAQRLFAWESDGFLSIDSRVGATLRRQEIHLRNKSISSSEGTGIDQLDINARPPTGRRIHTAMPSQALRQAPRDSRRRSKVRLSRDSG